MDNPTRVDRRGFIQGAAAARFRNWPFAICLQPGNLRQLGASVGSSVRRGRTSCCGGKIRMGLKIKVWKLLSGTDVINNQAANRQADSDNFRSWEIAGDSHVDAQFIASGAALARRDGNPIAPGFNPALEVTSAGSPAIIARDKAGYSLAGGIRLAEIAVPAGVNTGQISGDGFCRLYGAHEDFDAAALNKLHPTHSAFVAAVKNVTEKNFKAGYILRQEANATIAAAERSHRSEVAQAGRRSPQYAAK